MTGWTAPPEGPRITDVLESAAAAAGLEGAENRLGLPPTRRVVVVLVDGLGVSTLRRFAAHTPFLKSHLDRRSTISAVFPSTTAASLTSLGTGASPGAHGIVGYDVLARSAPGGPRVVNQLGNWDADISPEEWQTVPSVFSRCDDAGLPAYTVSQKRFAASALTRASLGGGTFVEAGSSDARVTETAGILKRSKRALVYAYWNEVDKAGHQYGMDSQQYVEALEDVDFALKRLHAQMPEDTLLLITADHGMVDIPASGRIDYSQIPELLDGIEFTGGEPRMLHLYWDPASSQAQREKTLQAWRDFAGPRAWVGEKDEVIGLGWFGDVAEHVNERIGDVLIAAVGDVAYFDGRRIPQRAFEMVGQHGSVTRAEMSIPLYQLRKGR